MMFIDLVDTEGEGYSLFWWQIRALKAKGKVTTVHINIDGHLDTFNVEMPRKEIEAAVENNRAMMDSAA